MDRFIKPFRELAPLVAKKLEKAEGQPVEAIAANTVVDGAEAASSLEIATAASSRLLNEPIDV